MASSASIPVDLGLERAPDLYVRVRVLFRSGLALVGYCRALGFDDGVGDSRRTT